MARIVHLVRHAQASLFGANYDALSELGTRQAGLLGEHLANGAARAVYTGSLERQRHTGEEIRCAFAGAGSAINVVELPGLNEFDPQIWRAFAAQLRSEDPQFAELIATYKARRQERHESAAALYAEATKRILAAWLEGRRGGLGTWFTDFSLAVRGAVRTLCAADQDELIAVTSTTPIALTICDALGLTPMEAGRFMKYTYNASISTFHVVEGALELVSWNGTPHLTHEVRTLV